MYGDVGEGKEDSGVPYARARGEDIDMDGPKRSRWAGDIAGSDTLLGL